jgi:multidrug resistance efflux pump
MSDSATPSIAITTTTLPLASGWRPVKNSKRAFLITSLIAILGVLSILAAWRLPPFESAVQRTDDAYVRGLTTVISPQVSGYVTEVFVQDYEEVSAGQRLFQIDARIYQQRVEQAKAQLDAQQANLQNFTQSLASRKAALASTLAAAANARAQLIRARADQKRAHELVSDGSISIREADQTQAALRQAEAALAQSTVHLRTFGPSSSIKEAFVPQWRAPKRRFTPPRSTLITPLCSPRNRAASVMSAYMWGNT